MIARGRTAPDSDRSTAAPSFQPAGPVTGAPAGLTAQPPPEDAFDPAPLVPLPVPGNIWLPPIVTLPDVGAGGGCCTDWLLGTGTPAAGALAAAGAILASIVLIMLPLSLHLPVQWVLASHARAAAIVGNPVPMIGGHAFFPR